MSPLLLLLYTWVLSDSACEYTDIAAIHMGFKRFCLNTLLLLLYTWVLSDFACEYTVIAAMHRVLSEFACEYAVIVAIHVGFKQVCF